LDVLLDMVFHPRLEPESIERERPVVLGAVNQESDYPAWELVRVKVDDLIFKTNEVESMGTAESVSRLTAEDLRDWHSRFYHVGNAILVVTGDLDEDAIHEATEAMLVGEERPTVIKESYSSHLYRKAAAIATGEAFVGFKFPPSYDTVPLALLQILLGNYPLSRLWQRLKREEPLAYVVEGRLRIHSDAGRLGLYLGITKPADVRRALDSLFELLAALSEEGVKPDELAWAKQVYRLELRIQASDPEGAATFLGERSLWGGAQSFASLEQRVKRIGHEELSLLARRIFHKESCYIGLIGPEVEWDPWELWP
jgi:zinc protease